MTKNSDLPTAPAHLSAEAADWWRSIVAEFDLEAADLKTLEVAATQLDRAIAARGVLAKSATGLLIEDRFGQWKTHPAVDVEQAATRLFLLAVRQIGLNLEPSPDSTRLPGPVAQHLRDEDC